MATTTPLDRWKELDVDRRKHDTFEQYRRQRANNLCSLWMFGRDALKRKDLNLSLHLPLCKEMQRIQFKHVFEVSRGHLKSTIGSEMLPMWRTLMVTDADIDFILNIKGADGFPRYNDDFCRYLLKVHDPNSTWILCSETESLAVGLLERIQRHYRENLQFRGMFGELLPHAVHPSGNRLKGKWGSKALVINRPERTIPEPTFECRGAGQPLQSKHVTGGIIEDDLVGEKSLKSLAETNKRVSWHTRLGGVFYDDDPDHTGNQLVIGNRWSSADLNRHIRDNEPWFEIYSMGCLWCDTCQTMTRIDLGSFKHFDKSGELRCIEGHPTRPVFPEKFTLRKVHQKWKEYSSDGKELDFTAQYLNDPGITSNGSFDLNWLQWYEYYRAKCLCAGPFCDHGNKPEAVVFLEKESDGEVDANGDPIFRLVLKRSRIAEMNRYMTLDPSYGSESLEACKNGLVVTGIDAFARKFILEAWGKKCGLKEVIATANMFADKWEIEYIHVEDAGGGRIVGQAINENNIHSTRPHQLRAQRIQYHGEFRNWIQASDTPITARKIGRIIAALQPVFEGEKIWLGKWHEDFLSEYRGFSLDTSGHLLAGTKVDILDAASYHPQLWRTPASGDDIKMLEGHMASYLEGVAVTAGY